jgi:hypothetical protein
MKKILTIALLFVAGNLSALGISSLGYYYNSDLSVNLSTSPTCACDQLVNLDINITYSSDPMTTPVSVDFGAYNLLTTDLQGLIDTINNNGGYFKAVIPCGVYGGAYVKMNGANAVFIYLQQPPIISITNPDTECSNNTVSISSLDVRSSNVSGSTFLYYQNSECTIPLSDASVLSVAGTYFIVTKKTYNYSSISCTMSDTGSVIVGFYDPSTLVITNPLPVVAPATVDITEPSITNGSVNVSVFTYWTNNQYNTPLSSPEGVSVSGTYFIRGESSDGCYSYNSNGVSVVVNTPTTEVIKPVDLTEKHVKYFDILGRPVVPKEGDMIRIAPYGAIVY